MSESYFEPGCMSFASNLTSTKIISSTASGSRDGPVDSETLISAVYWAKNCNKRSLGLISSLKMVITSKPGKQERNGERINKPHSKGTLSQRTVWLPRM